ncbi:ATP-binding protein [Pseudomonas sp. 21LCFQ010]|uniref:ATP-binding protein n=1 Tax=Pseudomonas sp. 21LCFQ010 TaxID=2957506 RepID=UPI002096A41B|nr:ATP-binding protein [Pseudomonas sp. 21LCFQ010]MCO8161047.1 ATP-binding protein [Pseudomonas sp. 21LCFQ010]
MRSETVSMTTPVDPIAPRIQPAECEIHGSYDQKVTALLGREFKGGCPECQRIANEEREAAERAEKAHQLRIAMARKLGAALIPKRFAEKTLAQYVAESRPQALALAICQRYVEVFGEVQKTGRCLMLLGKPGTGKTHLGAGIANDLMRNTSATAVYRTVGAVLQAIRATYDRSSDKSEAEILSSLIEPDLLVLDEVGVSKEQPSDFELTTLFAIINGRYEQVRPTVVISNLDAAQLPQAMGERCVDRLREGGGVVVVFDWESQRGKEGV